jgi:hypothetical protein
MQCSHSEVARSRTLCGEGIAKAGRSFTGLRGMSYSAFFPIAANKLLGALLGRICVVLETTDVNIGHCDHFQFQIFIPSGKIVCTALSVYLPCGLDECAEVISVYTDLQQQ